MKEDIRIKCPNCEWEYLPGEIYLPKKFLGQPIDIDRTSAGVIDCYDGTPQDLTESFVCEHCGKKFNVEARLSFTATIDAKSVFDTDYTTPLYEDRIFLKED